MSTLSYKIEFTTAAQFDLIGKVNAAVLPSLSQAVDAVAQQTAANWMAAIQHAKLRSREKDDYSKTITIVKTGDFSRMIESGYKYAQEIETGRPARDLKKMLDTSMKVRVSKEGTRYLIIPFRHNADTVPQQAKLLTKSTITGHGRRISGTGAYSLATKAPATVRQRQYNWGEKLVGPGVAKNQQGMVRMNTSTSKSKSSAYLTFRVMSEKSSGWIIKAQPGQHIAKGVADAMRPLAEDAFSEAVKNIR